MSAGKNAALERILTLAKSARGQACKLLVEQALGAPDIFTFGELLAMPSVQELAMSAPETLRMLQIFAFGTFATYRDAGLPALSPEQQQKLKLLTLVSLGSADKVLSYPTLMAQLDIPNVRALEDLVIEAVYSNLLTATLDQKQQQVEINFVQGRDLKDGDIDDVIHTLDTWCAQCLGLLHTMEANMEHASTAKKAAVAAEVQLVADVEALKATLATTDRHDGSRSGVNIVNAAFGGGGGYGGYGGSGLGGFGGGSGGGGYDSFNSARSGRSKESSRRGAVLGRA